MQSRVKIWGELILGSIPDKVLRYDVEHNAHLARRIQFFPPKDYDERRLRGSTRLAKEDG